MCGMMTILRDAAAVSRLLLHLGRKRTWESGTNSSHKGEDALHSELATKETTYGTENMLYITMSKISLRAVRRLRRPRRHGGEITSSKSSKCRAMPLTCTCLWAWRVFTRAPKVAGACAYEG